MEMQEINMSAKNTRERVGRNQLYEGYDDMPAVNRKVYNFIIENGMTQKEFADKIGMTQQNIGRLFRVYKGTGQYPKITKAVREGMMAVFNLPLDWFIADENRNPTDAPKGTNRKSQSARLRYVKDYLINTGRITSVVSLCEEMQFSRSYVTMTLKGDIEVSLNFLERLNYTFNNIFNINWILSGEGEMLAKKDDRNEIIKTLKEENARLKQKLQEAAMEIINLNNEIRALKN